VLVNVIKFIFVLQAFDKQGFHAGTPPPFNLPLGTGTQAGPLGAPTTPYAAAPFVNVPMMQQPHSQMLHPTLQQVGLYQKDYLPLFDCLRVI